MASPSPTLGWPILGKPDWKMAGLFVPQTQTIQGIQIAIMAVGLLVAVMVAVSAARRAHKSPNLALVEAAPWLLLLVVLAFTGITTFTLPMEMRGSALGG